VTASRLSAGRTSSCSRGNGRAEPDQRPRRQMTGKLTEVEERLMGPSGQRSTCQEGALISSDGRVEGMCGISTDITTFDGPNWLWREAVISWEGERDNKLMNIEVVTASIAHEVATARSHRDQRRARTAISGKGATRIDEVRTILNQLMGDCHRVSEVFDTIRALFRRVDQKREPTVVNEIVVDVLQSMREELTDTALRPKPSLRPNCSVSTPIGINCDRSFQLDPNAIESMITRRIEVACSG